MAVSRNTDTAIALAVSTGERAEIVVDFGGDEAVRSDGIQFWCRHHLCAAFIQDEYDTTDFAIFTIDIGPPSTPDPVTTLPGN